MRLHFATLCTRVRIPLLSFAILLASLPPASGSITVSISGGGGGTPIDVATFLGVLNASSTGGVWATGLFGGQLSFTPDGTPINNFAGVVNGYSSTDIILRVASNYPGVLVGGFLDNGIQALDMTDILSFPVGHAFLDTQASVIFHEIDEVGRARRDGIVYSDAHLLAIAAENNELANSNGGRGSRGLPPPTSRIDPATGRLELLIAWTDSTNPAITHQVIQLTGAGAISNIRSGLVDTGVSYDGSGLDVGIASIYAESAVVPEPSTALLLTLGLVALGTRSQRAR